MTERADTRECRRLAGLDRIRRLRPIVDPELDIVLIDCPGCGTCAPAPLGMWRPARLVPRGKRLTVICESCGERRVG
jgi:hypothetical protein